MYQTGRCFYLAGLLPAILLMHLINFEIYKDIDPPINAPKTKYWMF
jgi:hypothetical protein